MKECIRGVVCPGYGIASEHSHKTQKLVSNVYPDRRIIIVDKTVYRQFPHFINAGVVGIERMYPGTINVDISPRSFEVTQPEYEVACEWIDGIRETFWLTGIGICFNGKEYMGYLYDPCMSEQHPPRSAMVEVITEKIPGITYGSHVALQFDGEKIRIVG